MANQPVTFESPLLRDAEKIAASIDWQSIGDGILVGCLVVAITMIATAAWVWFDFNRFRKKNGL